MADEKRNVYAPPDSRIESPDSSHPASIGLTIGFLFMLPLMLVVVTLGVALVSHGTINKIPALVFLFVPVAEGLSFGRWCGQIVNQRSIVSLIVISMVQGAVLVTTIVVGALLLLRFSEGQSIHLNSNDTEPTLIAWMVCTVWSFFMIVTIRWRVLKLRKVQNADGE